MNRKFLKIFIIFAMIVGLYAIPAQAIPTVSLNLLDSDIMVGEIFNVAVLADGDLTGQELLAFGFDVLTTGDVFTYDDYTIGPGFDDDSFFTPPDVAGSAFPGIADDDVLLATLSFTATDVGGGSLQTLGVSDGSFYGLFYEFFNFDTFEPEFSNFDIDASLDIQVNPSAAPVPEPATILLLASGMAGLGVFGRKKFKK